MDSAVVSDTQVDVIVALGMTTEIRGSTVSYEGCPEGRQPWAWGGGSPTIHSSSERPSATYPSAGPLSSNSALPPVASGRKDRKKQFRSFSGWQPAGSLRQDLVCPQLSELNYRGGAGRPS